MDRVGVHLGLSATPWPFLEAYIGFHNSATSDNRSSPQLLQVLGDTNFGVKAFLPSAPDQIFQFGGALDLYLLNGMGGVGVDGSGTSFGMKGMAALALDRRSDPEKAIPVRFHFNMGYLFDNSASLVEDLEQNDPPDGRGQNISRIERFGLDINRVDFFQIGLGGEFIHPIIRPFVEWTIDVPVNRQNYVCNVNNAEAQGDACLGDNQVFSVAPSRFTLGARVFPWSGRGLSLLGAFDIGTGATSNFVDEVAPEPPWTLYFGLGYAVDTEPPKPIIQRVEKPTVAAAPIAPGQSRRGQGRGEGHGHAHPERDRPLRRPRPARHDQRRAGRLHVGRSRPRHLHLQSHRRGLSRRSVHRDGRADHPGLRSCAFRRATCRSSSRRTAGPTAWSVGRHSGWLRRRLRSPALASLSPRPPEPAAQRPEESLRTSWFRSIVSFLEALPKVGNVISGLVDQESGQAIAGARVITDRLNRSLELAAADTTARSASRTFHPAW